MNARTETAWLETPNLRTAARKPGVWGSPELLAAIDALAGYSLRQPDPTLEELRLALQGTGFTWSEEGKLTFSPDRNTLVSELDALIEDFGRDTSAADLFPRTKGCAYADEDAPVRPAWRLHRA